MGEPDSSTPPVYSPIITKPSLQCWLKRASRDYYIAFDHVSQLLRPERLPEAAWVAGPVRCRASRIVRKLARDRYGWPTDCFTPCDPTYVVFLYPWDDLEVVQLVRIEGALHIAIQDSHVEFRRTVGDVVDEAATLMPAREANPGAG